MDGFDQGGEGERCSRRLDLNLEATDGFCGVQGPFYCGVGVESVYGRQMVEAHMDACIKVG